MTVDDGCLAEVRDAGGAVLVDDLSYAEPADGRGG